MFDEKVQQIWPGWTIEMPEIGSGSYGVVYKAVRREGRHQASQAAIKVISIPRNTSELDSLRLEGLSLDETRTYLEKVVHTVTEKIVFMESVKGIQNIVSIEDYKVMERTEETGWDIFIRMELLTPFPLFVHEHPPTEEMALKLGIDICTALEICGKSSAMHGYQAFIHRDIKPGNILLNDFDDFKLGDFGIARQMESVSRNLSRNRGTPNYMAPEVENSRNYDARADLYSLGLVLYWMLNKSRLPFQNLDKQILSPMDREEALARRLQGEPITAPCNASPAMAELILRACQYDPAQRFSSASEMKRALLEVQRAAEQPRPVASRENIVSRLPVNSDRGPLIPLISGMSRKRSVPFGKRPFSLSAFLTSFAVLLALGGFIAVRLLTGQGDSPGLTARRNASTVFLAGQNLTEVDIHAIGNPSDVTQLYLHSNRIADIQNLSNLSHLNVLRLSSNVIRDISPLRALTNLSVLELDINEIEDLSALETLKNLTYLDLHNNCVRNLSPLRNLVKLKTLYLHHNAIEDLSSLDNLSNLTILYLWDNEIKDVSALGGLNNLTDLSLSNNRIDDVSCLGGLTNLKRLDLANNQIRDVSSLYGLSNLMILNLEGNPIPEEQIVALQWVLPNCNISH